MKYVWDQDAWADYVWWQTQDRRIAKRINELVRDIARATAAGSPHEGIGKPEALSATWHIASSGFETITKIASGLCSAAARTTEPTIS